jgi:hypothetical protein
MQKGLREPIVKIVFTNLISALMAITMDFRWHSNFFVTAEKSLKLLLHADICHVYCLRFANKIKSTKSIGN